MKAVISSLDGFLRTLQDNSFASAIRESTWLFPTIETVHVLAVTLMVGSIVMVDLRLIGLAYRDRPLTELADDVLPWTWTSFTVAVLSGASLFSSAAVKYAGNFDFRAKIVLLVLAGVNMAVFHLGAYRNARSWKGDVRLPNAARLAGGLSLLIWVAVVGFGRWIGFTT
jgi:hypothetical protein